MTASFLARCSALLTLSGAAAAANLPADLRVINNAVGFPEGPIYRGSTLYYVDYGGQGVRRATGHADDPVRSRIIRVEIDARK